MISSSSSYPDINLPDEYIQQEIVSEIPLGGTEDDLRRKTYWRTKRIADFTGAVERQSLNEYPVRHFRVMRGNIKVDINKLNYLRKKRIDEFAETVERLAHLMFMATEHLGTHPILGVSNFQSTGLILDQEIRLSSIALCLLVRPHSKIKLPIPSDFCIFWDRIWEARLAWLHLLSKTVVRPTDEDNCVIFPFRNVKNDPYPYDLRGIHYIFYRYQTPILELQNGYIVVHDKKLLNDFVKSKSNMWSLSEIITEEMIDEVIAEQMIPLAYRTQLMKYVGLRLDNALYHSGVVWGNVIRWGQIYQEELVPAKVAKIIESTDYLLEIYYDQQRTIEQSIWNDKNELKKGVKCRIIPKVKTVFKFLRGKIPIESLCVDKSNAYHFLTILKTIDWVTAATNCISLFSASFMEGKDAQLRSHIAKCVPNLTLHEVFLRSLNSTNLRDPRYWLVGSNWTSEMAAQIGRSCAIARVNADTLRQRQPGFFDGVRGGSAMCKSSMYIKEFGKASKWFQTPDNRKWDLRQLPFLPGEVLLNHQVHPVGLEFYIAMLKELNHIPGMSYGLDERLLYPKVLLERLIYPAENQNGSVRLRDLAARRLTPSLLRMLLRKPWGKEPAQATWVLVGGHKDSIIYRKAIIDIVRERDVVTEYRLYLDGIKVAEKKGKAWHVYDQQGYQECIEPPVDLDDQIYEDVSQIITPELIHNAVVNKYIYPSEAQELVGWIGLPLEVAVDMNAEGKSFR